MSKTGRNEPCPCGSGRKYKKCHGDSLRQDAAPKNAGNITPAGPKVSIQEHKANEEIRIKQQGLGREIISGQVGDYTVVAAGNTLYSSKKWKTFPDFLKDYIIEILGKNWAKEEVAKPFEQRHPIFQWHDTFYNYLAANQTKKGEIFSAPTTGAVNCYLGLAYSLYLIKHNVELQERLVARLKDIRQFQGAYYELIVANCLIRAGFKLELEDETDETTKHCEFSARSTLTGKRYWVEAKMRSVAGVLGKSENDGTKSKDPTSSLTKHLREALKKPSLDDRLIFIDLNAENYTEGGKPKWLDQAVRRLEDKERDLKAGQEAYVLVTNLAFHRLLNTSVSGCAVLAHGLGIPDFGKPGKIRLSEKYRQKQKHIDIHNIGEAFASYSHVPDTFDGRPASELFSKGENNRIRIGQTYYFPDAQEKGITGTVESVAVIEKDQQFYATVWTHDKKRVIISGELSDAELEDYKKFGPAYFGEANNNRRDYPNVYEIFEWLVECYSNTSKEKLLELAGGHPNIKYLRSMEQFDLVLELCEEWAAAIEAKQKRGQS